MTWLLWYHLFYKLAMWLSMPQHNGCHPNPIQVPVSGLSGLGAVYPNARALPCLRVGYYAAKLG